MNRSYIFCSLMISFFSLNGVAQQTLNPSKIEVNIVGVWQAKSAVEGSSLLENFQFFSDGFFHFNTNSNDDLNPLRQISGFYKLDSNILQLRIQKLLVRTCYKVFESDHGFESGPFQLKDGQLKIVAQSDSTYSEHDFRNLGVGKRNGIVAIEIDGDKYYRISENPRKYQK